MTTTELKNFKNVLTERQQELEGFIRHRDAAAIETSADALDQIQHAVEREFALGSLERESAYLRDTRAALGRMGRGVFGTCLDCEDDINRKRLAAVPWAARCIACEERKELGEAAPPRPGESLLAEAA